jgi:hypothetical protein
MKRILLAFLCLFATSAFAIGIGNDNPSTLGGDVTNVSANTNLNANSVSNRISNEVRNNALSFAAGGVGVGMGQGGVGQAVSGGSTSNVDFNITSPKNTPAVFSGNVYPTTNCAHSATVGGAGVGFGFSIGGSYLDDECSLRETARSFQLLNMVSDAVAVLCASKYAAAAPACKSIAAAGGSPEQK